VLTATDGVHVQADAGSCRDLAFRAMEFAVPEYLKRGTGLVDPKFGILGVGDHAFDGDPKHRRCLHPAAQAADRRDVRRANCRLANNDE
jgi:hypothetical protein